MSDLEPVNQRLPQIYSIYDPILTSESLRGIRRVEQIPELLRFAVWPVVFTPGEAELEDYYHEQMWGTFSGQNSEFVIASNDDCAPHADALYERMRERAHESRLNADGIWRHNTGHHIPSLGIYDYFRGARLVQSTLSMRREYLQKHPA